MIDTLESPYIVAATSGTFNALVLDNSNKGPVLVNFWSKKAGPCLRQYPILDQLIHRYEGRVLLVNVDADSEPAATKEYGISSVPTLKLFRHGKLVETWHGYQSEQDLTKVLDLYVARESDQVLARAVQFYTQGKQAEAYEMIANAIVEDPVNPRLPLTMCKLLKHEGRYEEALKLIEALPGDIRHYREVVQLHALLGFYRDIDPARDMNALAAHVASSPDDLEARRQLAAQYAVHGQYQQALEELAAIIDTDPGFRDNYGKSAMLRLFNVLGADDALVSKYRPKLARYAH